MPKIEFLSTAAMAQVFACRGPPLFFAIATSLLPVLGVFHLIYIVTGPIKCWGCKLVFFPMKIPIASKLEISVERTVALLPVSCATPNLSSSCDRSVKEATALAHHAYFRGN
jgi:hypothetical protein